MKRRAAYVLLTCAALVYLYGLAHLAVAADRNHAGELGAGLDLAIAGARWLGASLAPAVVALLLLVRRRRVAPRPAPSPPLQHLADRPGGVSVAALVPWRRPPPALH